MLHAMDGSTRNSAATGSNRLTSSSAIWAFDRIWLSSFGSPGGVQGDQSFVHV